MGRKRFNWIARLPRRPPEAGGGKHPGMKYLIGHPAARPPLEAPEGVAVYAASEASAAYSPSFFA